MAAPLPKTIEAHDKYAIVGLDRHNGVVRDGHRKRRQRFRAHDLSRFLAAPTQQENKNTEQASWHSGHPGQVNKDSIIAIPGEVHYTPVSLLQQRPDTRNSQDTENQARKQDEREVDPPMRGRQQADKNFNDVPECVSNHEKRDHQEHGTATLQLQCAPVKCEPENDVGKPDIADQMAVWFTCRKHVRRDMEKPLDCSRDHPDSVGDHGSANNMKNGLKNLLLRLQRFLHEALIKY